MSIRRDIGRVPLALLVGVLAAALLAPAGETHPPALIGPKGKEIFGKRHRWLHQSRMPLVGGRVQLIIGACPGVPRFAGCVFTRRPRRIYLRRDARSPKSVLYHELGHTFDLTLLRHRDRRALRRILHLGRRGWFAGSPAPSELFAEAYALCARFGRERPPARRLGWTRSIYGYRPSRKQHRAVCDLVLRAGAKQRQRRRPKPQPPANPPPVFEQQPPQPPPKEEPPNSDPFPDLPGVPGLPPLPGASL
jgi:hypothetical protein